MAWTRRSVCARRILGNSAGSRGLVSSGPPCPRRGSVQGPDGGVIPLLDFSGLAGAGRAWPSRCRQGGRAGHSDRPAPHRDARLIGVSPCQSRRRQRSCRTGGTAPATACPRAGRWCPGRRTRCACRRALFWVAIAPRYTWRNGAPAPAVRSEQSVGLTAAAVHAGEQLLGAAGGCRCRSDPCSGRSRTALVAQLRNGCSWSPGRSRAPGRSGPTSSGCRRRRCRRRRREVKMTKRRAPAAGRGNGWRMLIDRQLIKRQRRRQ